ncbi:TonB-dependent receptor domain-containing protein [Pedobacter sp. SYP-B3415]|uniref:TonB-dependent receptor domain-containing protein n=1 Tax=Pedobacter sp. SYP-B3415 TaxID=2496641 RepID=UPI00101CC365|nr:TonB-dependent receptor [Pedobacter sp. SYP-B3415]
MKRILLSVFFLTLFVAARAQFPMGGALGGGAKKASVTGRIVATIIDSVSRKPIDYATVTLLKVSDNKSVNGGVTDEKGRIVLQNVAPDSYKLAIGFMGYNTKTVLVKTTPEKPDNNIGNVILAPSANSLKDVTVVGQKAMIENKVDRMVYNAEADITNAGGDATDVMRKVPMLSVDASGNVQLRGGAVRVLINGKPSGTMANSVADALKMIPAEQIKSVEVITSPSAKYDAEGSGGIINIITKKNNAQGISGSVNASAGTRQNNGNVSLNAKSGRLGFTSNVGGIYAYPQESKVLSFNQTQTAGGLSTIQSTGLSNWTRKGLNGTAGLDYDINNYHNVSTNVKVSSFSNGGPGSSDILLNQVLTRNTSDMDMGFNNLDWTMDYRKTSKREGEELVVSGQATFGRNPTDFANRLVVPGVPDVITTGNNRGKNNEYTGQIDYTYPFSKKVILEAGAKGIFRTIISDILDDPSRNFDYSQDVASAYGVVTFPVGKKVTAKAGLRAEYTDIGATSGANPTIKNDYFNLFPSVVLSQTLKGMSTIKVSYNRRLQRPSLFYLNPFENRSDQFNIMRGNPALNPELSDNFEVGYNTFIKGSVINASLFYRTTGDIIESIISPITENGITRNLTTYANIGRSPSYGLNLFGSYNPKPKWTLMSNIALNTYEVNNQVTGVNTGTFLNYNIFARSAYALNKGWSTEVWGVLNSPRRTFQGKTDAMYFYGAAVKKEILNKKASIGINVLNPFNRDLNIKTVNTTAVSVQSQDIYYPLRSFGLNFSYNFGKLKFTQKKSIKNDDLKQGDQGAGGVGGMGGGTNR